MDLKLLKCFLTAAQELHFGRAAQKLDILPSALGRNIKLLEEELGLRLFVRSTRNIELTKSGHVLLHEARFLLDASDSAIKRVRSAAGNDERVFRIGAIDSAATGLVPPLIHDFKDSAKDVELVLVEDKTVRMLPKLLAGTLDIAFVRPPLVPKPDFEFDFLLNEPTFVALPARHALARKRKLRVVDLAKVPMIVPSPRSRPHSHNLTMSLFSDAGHKPIIAQQADEKQTIVSFVAAKIGVALVPFWTSRISVEGVVFRPLVGRDGNVVCELPLAAAWVRGAIDANRTLLLEIAKSNLSRYAA